MKKGFLLLLLAGCTTVGPDYKRPEMPLPEDFASSNKEGTGEIPADW